MMLRSSSTPVLGSLLQSFSESPNNNNNHHHHHSDLHGYGSTHKHTPNSGQCKLSCTNGGFHNVKKSFFHSPSVAESTSKNGFRRVQSEGNLDELVGNSRGAYDEFSLSKRSGGRRKSCSTLEAIPSFSVHHLGTPSDDSDDEEEESEHEETCGELETGYISKPLSMDGYGNFKIEGEGKMYLATGLGFSGVDLVDDCGNGGSSSGGGYRPVALDRDGGDSRGISMEEHYKKMLQENPGDPLFLRNYAQFLYQVGPVSP